MGAQALTGLPMNHVTTADQAKHFVKDAGSGRPVIFTHGWPLSSDI